MESSDRERKKAWKAAERQKAKEAFPLPGEALDRLFAYVAHAVEAEGCDHSLRATKAWLATEACDRQAVIAWLEENGGYCDCEVLGNAADAWQRNR